MLAEEESSRRISLFVGGEKSESSIGAGVVKSSSLFWRDVISQLRREKVFLKKDSALSIDPE